VGHTATEPIIHADMDAFYASVEQRDNPDLAGKPVVVGGAGNRGVVAAASYEAREYGIRSAMPMVRARRQCPDLVVISGNFDKYREASKAVMEIFRSFTPLVEPISLDEAFLDVGGAVRLFGPPVEIGQQLRARVREQVNLPCSVGIGPNKFAAKLLSAKAKPDGLLHVTAAELPAFLRPLPVGDLWGAGPKTVERLHSYGFRTVGQLADTDQRTLERVVGAAVGSHLHALALGRDVRHVTPHEAVKSVSHEVTFDEDIDDPDHLGRVILSLGEKVGRRLRRNGLAGRTVTLKIRFASFETITRSATLPNPTDRTHDLVDIATDLFDSLRLERVRVRLLGVGMSNLSEAATARQLSIEHDRRWEDIDRAADAVADKFGSERIGYAALLEEEEAAFRYPTKQDRPSDE
jgi:DNA polymerase-4